ncbi:hypothetical protein DSCA_08860 [Desulfosarcina alkanivorans]|jgi:hypothetical protein|uniref:Uncharacterized protein n=1 Tax=Desulfosarcina alkanivorans TaxID=571177 RepID=A0A5K7YDB2_9BACT|nr:hypothetical protein [Desulfosarcina alkanivorans]BBO66956.1 hypothetical protein DSCA_08860 [Desulfosarcina alkanivorans]
MSLRLIARDLYRRQQEVDRLEKELSGALPAQRDPLKRRLARAKAEREAMRRILDGRLDR